MRKFDAVVFDMDGTLIEAVLDFAAIRRDLGIGAGRGVLEAIEEMPLPRRALCRRRLAARELAGARRARLMPGAAEVVTRVRAAGLKTALLTRNTRRATEIVLGRFAVLRMDLVLSREDGPIKPAPEGVLRACRQLGVAPARTACVGDFRYDVIAANAAGAYSVLLVAGRRPAQADEADAVIAGLGDLARLLGA